MQGKPAQRSTGAPHFLVPAKNTPVNHREAAAKSRREERIHILSSSEMTLLDSLPSYVHNVDTSLGSIAYKRKLRTVHEPRNIILKMSCSGSKIKC